MREDERNRLLNPEWLRNRGRWDDEPLYRPSTTALAEWLEELTLGVQAGLISDVEARALIMKALPK